MCFLNVCKKNSLLLNLNKLNKIKIVYFSPYKTEKNNNFAVHVNSKATKHDRYKSKCLLTINAAQEHHRSNDKDDTLLHS